ncbi:hypothetical protein Bca52824_035997 [Brassica carinata]|uniref:Uncharacterized protein n=1 Tax=Brassica carinata TaxID=52824 RepID=A0A8X7S3X1_BRACI|nr:hypothetical protein Bca52824_035997 [Brassica carinata]
MASSYITFNGHSRDHRTLVLAEASTEKTTKKAMEYRKLGDSEINISEITMGTTTFGEQNTEKESHEMLSFAVEHGINCIDTAEAVALYIYNAEGPFVRYRNLFDMMVDAVISSMAVIRGVCVSCSDDISVNSLDKYAISKYAESFKFIPKSLADNAGLNAMEIIRTNLPIMSN